MQHAGLQYGQGAVNSHQSPPFAHADIPQNNSGNTTSSLRQFRKKDGTEKNSAADLNTSVESSHIARVPPHNHYPARPNDYYRYQHQFPDYNSPYKETPAQVKYSEIAETPPQSIQHVDHMPAALQKHKEVHKDFMDMCNVSQQPHMKQNYPDNLTRQQSYPPDAASVHHQYLHKEPQVHPGYKPESQYQQYSQLPKYNMPSQCRKYPPPPENDFLAKLQRINPSMARSIMSDHHIRESQTTFPTMDQNRFYSQNQRYYPPSHLQNNMSYNYQPYNYQSSCNYKHPEYPRTSQMPVGGAQYPSLNPHTDRSISPRNLHMMNYGTSPQKISPTYSQYNPPEYAQHYQHRRASLPQEYYQQNCRANPYMGGHQISPQPDDNRTASGGLRHFIENWAEEEASAEVTSNIFKDMRVQHNDSNNEQVFVINSSDIPQCLENVSLVPTENGQYIIKAGALDNSVVRIKETTETSGERTVNVQIVEAASKPDCMLAEENCKTTEENSTVPYEDNQNQNLQNEKDCDGITKTNPPIEQQEPVENRHEFVSETQEKDESSAETSVIVSNEMSIIKDMPLIEEEHAKNEEKQKLTKEKENAGCILEKSSEETDEKIQKDNELEETNNDENLPCKEIPAENYLVSTTKRTQRIFSVDDIINNIGSSPTETRRNSLQFVPKGTNEETNCCVKEAIEDSTEDMEYRNAVSIDDDSVILEIGGAWVQLNINNLNGTKVLSVLALTESLVIDVNGNYQESQDQNVMVAAETFQNLRPSTTEDAQSSKVANETNSVESKVNQDVSVSGKCTEEIVDDFSLESVKLKNQESFESVEPEQHLEDIGSNVYQSEIVIGEESVDNEVFIELNFENTTTELSTRKKEQELEILKERELFVGKEEEDLFKKKEEFRIVDEQQIEEIEKTRVMDREDDVHYSNMKVPLVDEKHKEVNNSKEKLLLGPVNQKEEELQKPKIVETSRRRDEKRKFRDSDDRKKASSKRIDERRESEENCKLKQTQKWDDYDVNVLKNNQIEGSQQNINTEVRKHFNEDTRRKEFSICRTSEKTLLFHEKAYEESITKKGKYVFLKSKKEDKKIPSQSNIEEGDSKKKEAMEIVPKFRKPEHKSLSLLEVLEKKNETSEHDIKVKNKLIVEINSTEYGEDQQNDSTKFTKKEKKRTPILNVLEKEYSAKVEITNANLKSVANQKKLAFLPDPPEALKLTHKEIFKENEKILRDERTSSIRSTIDDNQNQKIIIQEEHIKSQRNGKCIPFLHATEKKDSKEKEVERKEVDLYKAASEEAALPSYVNEEEQEVTPQIVQVSSVSEKSNNQHKEKKISQKYHDRKEGTKAGGSSIISPLSHNTDVIKIAEEMITLKQLEETKEIEKHPTKAAKKLYISDSPLVINLQKETKFISGDRLKQKRSISKLEETVKKIKSLKEKSAKDDGRAKKTSLKETVDKRAPKVTKKVTFNLETEIREITKEEMDKKKLSLQEYNSRKRKASIFNEPEQMNIEIVEGTVVSRGDVSDEFVEQVKLSIQNSVKDSTLKKSAPRMAFSNWEDDSSSPEPATKDNVILTTNRKCIIDVNEFSIKPIESISTPSPVSSSQFSYHSEDDSLQVYKDVVDSKLSSLNLNLLSQKPNKSKSVDLIQKTIKPKPVDQPKSFNLERVTVLVDRFLNRVSLNHEELEEVKKFIEIKRQMLEGNKKLTYEVKGERNSDYNKDLKLHFRKVPEKRKKKRFRNLYTEETSEDSDSSRSDKGVGDYSVYQRDSQGVPKLIFKRKSGLPQPFVKLERSQAVELLAKKRKLY